MAYNGVAKRKWRRHLAQWRNVAANNNGIHQYQCSVAGGGVMAAAGISKAS
jgi:hypothetical protein